MPSVDCDCSEGLEGECNACKQEALERAIEIAMLNAEDAEQD